VRRFWIVIFLALGAACFAAATGPRTPIVLEHANSLTSSEVNGVRMQELRGEVRMVKDSLVVTCQRAVYYPDSGIVIFSESVEFHDPHRVLFADQVVYNDNTEEVNASYHVRVYQGDTISVTSETAHYYDRLKNGYLYNDVRMREQSRRVLLTGKTGYVEHENQYGRVIGDPVVTETDSLGKLLTKIRGDTVEYFGKDKMVRVTGHVKVDRDSLYATGSHLEYYTKDHYATLVGNPEALRGQEDVKGDSILLYFDKDKETLNRVEVIGNSVATSPADSGFSEPVNTLRGKRMTLWIVNNLITEALVQGTATATYFVRDKGEKRGENITSGDRVRVFFDDRKMSRIRVEGGTEGTYKPQRLVAKSS
jgi:lipopolysaccharide assembly outer membrane protein LptD (OstA)